MSPQSPSSASFFKTPQPSTPIDDLVLALYDFTASAPSTNRCLSFKAGQVIRVVNRDQSGWWDGEMVLNSKSALNTSSAIQRGWFPSNYVNSIPISNIASFELAQKPSQQRRPSLASLASSNTNDILLDSPLLSLDHQTSLTDIRIPSHSRTDSDSTLASQNQPFTFDSASANSLWQPIALAIRTLHSQVHIHPNFDVQPATAKIISAVRAALDSTGCLGRHAPALKLYPNLTRARKQLLCSLSSLVDLAREITPSQSPSTASQFSQQEAKQTLLRLSDQVLTHTRELLRIAQRYSIIPNSPSSAKFNNNNNNNSNHTHDSLLMTSAQRSMSVSSPHPPNPLQPPRMIRPCKSVGTLVKFPSSQSTPKSFPLANTIPSDQHHHHQQAVSTTANHRRLASINSVQSTTSIPSSAIVTPVCTTQILEMVEQAHDQVLSTVAVLIGHAHMHSLTSHAASHAHLIDMTRDVIENVCEMLTLVECISKNPQVRNQQQPQLESQNDSPISQARESLYVATTRLVTSARVATSATPGTPPMIVAPAGEDDEVNSLFASATAVLRATNSCMDAVSDCLARMDPTYADFELSSNRPSINTYFGKELSLRSRHTLSMLGRKASALTVARNPIDSESHSGHWSSAASQDWKNSLTPEGSSMTLRTASDTGSLYSPDSSFMTESAKSVNRLEKEGPQTTTTTTTITTSSPSPSLSGLSSSDGIKEKQQGEDEEGVSVSPSTANSSDGRHSRESSPATSTSISRPEKEPVKKLPTPAKRANPKALTLQIPNASVGSQNPDSWQRELLFNSEGQVVGGTLRGLVGRMTSHDTPVEATFFHTFFMTFRLFTSSVEFSNALIARFSLTFEMSTPVTPNDSLNNMSKVTPIRLRVYNVMKSWLELHWRMETDEVVLPAISRWAESQLSIALPVPAERLMDLVHKRMKESQLGIHHQGQPTRTKANKLLGPDKEENFGKQACPSPIISKAVMTHLRATTTNPFVIQLTEFDATELARQITLMESKLFQAIKSEEVIGQLFNKKPSLAGNVRAMSAMSTKMTGWFTETILNEVDLRKRTAILKFLIKLGSKLLEMQNYNALMSVMSALNSSTILRLKRTWEGLGNKSRMLFETMNKAVNHQRNYAEYRATLRHARTPCIPFLGVYLTDMTFCHEGNPTHRSAPHLPGVQLINFDKYQKMTKIMNEIERFQEPFKFTEVPQIAAYIRTSLANLMSYQDSADELYQRSLLIEPREPSPLPPPLPPPPPSSSSSSAV